MVVCGMRKRKHRKTLDTGWKGGREEKSLSNQCHLFNISGIKYMFYYEHCVRLFLYRETEITCCILDRAV